MPTQQIPTVQPQGGPANYGTISLEPLTPQDADQGSEFNLEDSIPPQNYENQGYTDDPYTEEESQPQNQGFSYPPQQQQPQGFQNSGAEPLYFTSVDTNRQKKNKKPVVNPKFKPKTGIFNRFFNKDDQQ